MTETNDKLNKTTIENLLNLIIMKGEYSNMTTNEQKTFKTIEKEFFNSFDKLKLTFKQQNSMFMILGDYADNHQTMSLNKSINQCLNIMRD